MHPLSMVSHLKSMTRTQGGIRDDRPAHIVQGAIAMVDVKLIDGTCCTAFEARRHAKEGLDSATRSLMVEFAEIVPAGTVLRVVARAREDLLRSGVRQGLASATYAMARHRLQASAGSGRIGRSCS